MKGTPLLTEEVKSTLTYYCLPPSEFRQTQTQTQTRLLQQLNRKENAAQRPRMVTF